jgi:hypothetical protein
MACYKCIKLKKKASKLTYPFLNLGTFLVESNSPNFKPTANDVIVIFL